MGEDLLSGPENDQPGRDVIIIFAVFFELALAPFSLIFGWFTGHAPLQTFVWNANDAFLGAAAAGPLIAIFVAILTWPVGPLAGVKTFCEREVVPLFAQSNWSELALISLSAGVGEEMLFRGVIQASLTTWLRAHLGDWWGVVAGLALASMLFGLLHPISLPYVGITALLGFYIGAVWIFSGNLLTVMVTHALYDFAALGFIIRVQHGDDEPD